MVGLYFTDKPQTKFPMLLQLEHDGAINIPPGVRDFLDLRRFSSCPWTSTCWPCTRTRITWRTLMEGYATLPDGTRKWLIRIPALGSELADACIATASLCFCPRAR